MESTFNFIKVRGSSRFARVTISTNASVTGVHMAVPPYDPADRLFQEWLGAARSGAESALQVFISHGGKEVGLDIKNVIGVTVDTTLDAVEVASFCAAWKALGNPESELTIEFDDSSHTWKVKLAHA